jgi:ATP sulfurylase
VIEELEEGDMLYLDFDSLVLRVQNTRTKKKGHVIAQVVVGGLLGSNKGVVIDSAHKKHYDLPPLSEKDKKAIKIGLREKVGHIAASFMRSGDSVKEVRRATKGKMKIVSKIECTDALDHIEDIIQESDYLLIDRGDLSKEIAVERVPLVQKVLIDEARKQGKGVYVATNLLETMIEKRKPTRAEVHDIEQIIVDGAHGLTLAAETAIGKHPLECINTLTRIIEHVRDNCDVSHFSQTHNAVKGLSRSKYLRSYDKSDSLISPHGGLLVSGLIERPDERTIRSLPKLNVSDEHFMDAEQIALGTFSPVTGFLGSKDTLSVLDSTYLTNGTPWPLPIVLDVSREEANTLPRRGEVVLSDMEGKPFGILTTKERFALDKKEYAHKLYNTLDEAHPGVRAVFAMGDVCLSGDVHVFRRRPSHHKCYELTPRQARRLFEERGWRKIVGFHTRNVIHRGHEFIQLEAMKRAHADGLFVHPVIGKKKKGDFQTEPIVRSYETMIEKFYPRDRVVFATYSTFSRYAGPREALFTALCRKNFGCSHFVVGRDHTGVGDFYHPKASHKIFEKFSDIGIEPVIFDKVFYSRLARGHVHEGDDDAHSEKDKKHISGTEARALLLSGKELPSWFMRPEISDVVLDLQRKKIFVD